MYGPKYGLKEIEKYIFNKNNKLVIKMAEEVGVEPTERF